MRVSPADPSLDEGSWLQKTSTEFHSITENQSMIFFFCFISKVVEAKAGGKTLKYEHTWQFRKISPKNPPHLNHPK